MKRVLGDEELLAALPLLSLRGAERRSNLANGTGVTIVQIDREERRNCTITNVP